VRKGAKILSLLEIQKTPLLGWFLNGFLAPARNCNINKRILNKERQESVLLPGSKNPYYSVFSASLNPNRLIGSMNTGHGGSLVGRHDPTDSGKEGEGCRVFWLEWMFQKISFLHRVFVQRGRSVSRGLMK
jgi:hypothetical protein